MKTTFASFALAAAACTMVSCNSDGKKSDAGKPAPSAAPAPPLTYQDSASVVVTERVEAIDYAARRVTLRDASGRSTTYLVSPTVQRLNEVKVGDSVTASYTVTLEAQLRPPTADEAAHPIAISEVAGRSAMGTDPSAGARRRVTIVTTVEAVDMANMRVTLRGPMGDTTTVLARNPENVKKLHVGDTIVITYVESSTISVAKPG